MVKYLHQFFTAMSAKVPGSVGARFPSPVEQYQNPSLGLEGE
jgi:hypothetical protein